MASCTATYQSALRPTQVSEPTSLDLERIHELASHHVSPHQHWLLTVFSLELLLLDHDLLRHLFCFPQLDAISLVHVVVRTWIPLHGRRVHVIVDVHLPMLTSMMRLSDLSLRSGLAMYHHGSAAGGFTVVFALEIDCLASFSANAKSLIDSSSAQMRLNLPLGASCSA